MPSAGLTRVHGDPEQPVPAVSDSAMLASLPGQAVDAFVAAAGPGSGSSLLLAELRQLGGALGREAPDHGALPMLDAAFALFACGMAMTEEMGDAARADAERVTQALAPWSTERSYLSFTETPTRTSTGYRDAAFARLQRIRTDVDPMGLLHANHAIDPVG